MTEHGQGFYWLINDTNNGELTIVKVEDGAIMGKRVVFIEFPGHPIWNYSEIDPSRFVEKIVWPKSK